MRKVTTRSPLALGRCYNEMWALLVGHISSQTIKRFSVSCNLWTTPEPASMEKHRSLWKREKKKKTHTERQAVSLSWTLPIQNLTKKTPLQALLWVSTEKLCCKTTQCWFWKQSWEWKTPDIIKS